MNFAAENKVDPEDQTQWAGSFPTTQNSDSAIDYLVAVRKNRQLVKVFRPREKSISFGRSSRCSITLSDPRFSRKAGDIVLGPVPILRRYRQGKENSERFPVHPGRPYRFRPYSLTLLGPGDVIFNRKKNDENKARFLISVLIIFAISGAGSIALLHHGMTDTAAEAERGNDSFSGAGGQSGDEIKTRSGSKESENDEEMKTRTSASSEPFIKERTAVPETSSYGPTSTQKKKEGVKLIVRYQTEEKSRKPGAHADALARAVKAAALLIERGDLKTAGRILSPLMPHLDNEQQKKVIDALDPPVQSLFQKAYMLKPYEPGRSKEILQGIVESKLELLPGYGKARRVLEGEGTWQLRIAN
jgi:hypothetical protein